MTLRIGILGAAGIAPAAVIRPALRRTDVEVRAVASRRAGAAREYADRYGIPVAHDSYESLLADPQVDLVYNALPPSEHADWSIAALRAGKHVLCEKPFAMNAREAQAMVAVARETGLRLIEAFHDRYHPLSARVAEIVGSGRLGTLRTLRAVFAASIPFSDSSIRHVPELGGGALMDLGCYPVHWLRALLGEEPEVTGATATTNPLGADQSIEATLAFPSGAVATVAASMDDGPLVQTLDVEGDDGRLHVEGLVFPWRGHTIREETGRVDRSETVAGGETYDHQLAGVVNAITTDAPALTEGEDPIANMRVIDAIYAAAGISRDLR